VELAAALNHDCQCVSVDRDRLRRALDEAGLGAGSDALAAASIFADVPVFLSRGEVASIVEAVAALRRVTESPAFVDHALRSAPAAAGVDHGLRGTLYGYDFHLTADGPRLIEINTNAGGALLNVALARTQEACCDEVTSALAAGATGVFDVPKAIVESFVREFRRQRGTDAALSTIAIVDVSPESQFLYPEFRMFQALFRAHGIDAVIADVSELAHRDGALWHEGKRIDVVYNRLTDFYFSEPTSTALGAAYAAGDVVVTPNPRAHALHANKRLLVTLSDAAELSRLGIDDGTIAVLRGAVLHAELLDDHNRDRLWAERKRYFFKPFCGYGSKAAYRGDKLTHKTWDAMRGEEYIAQELALPSERVVRVGDTLTPLKLDVRAYVDDQQVLLLSSRLYQGQTTNFRTAGGGFATVFSTIAP